MLDTVGWHNNLVRPVWDKLIPEHYPGGIGEALEVGSFEGVSACHLLELGARDLLCVDTWQGSPATEPDYLGMDMAAVKARFDANTAEAAALHGGTVTAWVSPSVDAMSAMIAARRTFDFIYIDGCHTASAALTDAVLAFHLCRPGGWVYFDDYEWQNRSRPGQRLYTPKAGVDAFCDLFSERITCVRSQFQVHVRVDR